MVKLGYITGACLALFYGLMAAMVVQAASGTGLPIPVIVLNLVYAGVLGLVCGVLVMKNHPGVAYHLILALEAPPKIVFFIAAALIPAERGGIIVALIIPLVLASVVPPLVYRWKQSR